MIATADPLMNYEVPPMRTLIVRGHAHPTGDVLPSHYADWDGGLAERVKNGHLIPTTKPAMKVALPEPRTVDDPLPALALELNKLNTEKKELTALVQEHAATVAELRRQSIAKDTHLGEQTAEID